MKPLEGSEHPVHILLLETYSMVFDEDTAYFSVHTSIDPDQSYLRVLYLPDPKTFRFFVGCVLLYIGVRLLYEMTARSQRGKKEMTARSQRGKKEMKAIEEKFNVHVAVCYLYHIR